jgi:hypothetical protein
MTIHWKALEEHFLMVTFVFRFTHFRGKNAFSEFFSTSVLKELRPIDLWYIGPNPFGHYSAENSKSYDWSDRIESCKNMRCLKSLFQYVAAIPSFALLESLSELVKQFWLFLLPLLFC